MSKTRVYELAKELKLSSKGLIKILDEEFGLEVSSHMSVLEDENLELIKEYFAELEEEKSNKNKKKKEIIEKEEIKDYEEYNDEYEKIDRKKKKKQKKDKKLQVEFKEDVKQEQAESKIVYIEEGITIKEFAEKLNKPVTVIITELMKMGIMSNMNQEIEIEKAIEIGMIFDIEVEEKLLVEENDANDISSIDFEDKEEDLELRAPVVTVMGHVDHGKTSLLDKMRHSRVTSTEAGGITQHIGASSIYVDGKKIVFLDTPGHEAFTQMRLRGANATDIAILVVAADDGVMPQTIEAINHAKAAGVPIIVAINKMDKYEANPDKVKSELAEQGLTPEDWGGKTIMIPVSAHTGEGIDELLEMILMVAEIEELKANPNRPAVGIVIEAQLDKGRGPVATVLINKGTLNKGDFVVSGRSSGKVRAMFDSNQKEVKKAKPSTAVLILGLSDVPEAGDKIYAIEDEKLGKKFADRAAQKEKDEFIKRTSKVNLDQLFNKISDGEVKDLNIIVKTDVKGTIEAVSTSLTKLSNEEVKVNVIHGAVGGINESDVMLASASDAIIIGFNVRPNQGAKSQAEAQDIEIRTYRVIYEAIEDIKKAINGMLAPKFVEQVIGTAEVREVFRVPNVGNIAGIYVTNGQMQRNAKIRLLRNDVVIHEGEITSLKRYKDDVKELNQGYEGGLGIQNYNDIKVGDTLEAFIDKEVER
ncbi:translation initiation factor IF-2 [Helcococcus ovis]|uniref:Translation initiation factor IF-2 n=1 Tax=Helcococcus ovis TaxID=72026 RepID=A0A4R9C167_9FIRM|nr:translation initiation factor IF-2 [Helcococcus ovis]TFF65449.1 translation initiation factor IF-2 [Helcococcus ovis]TFF66085.1 translation initiation factor IF-2 [Helcococcus ovis]